MAKKNEKAFRIYYTKGLSPEYEVHARKVESSTLFGFVELSEFIYPKKTSLIIEPGSERAEREFKEVKRTHIPIKDIIRIDEYEMSPDYETSHLTVVEFKRPEKKS